MKYFQSTIERLLYVLIVLIMAIGVAGALVIYDVISKQNRLIVSQEQTLTELKAETGNHTEELAAINGGFSNLNTKVNCIFAYFTTPNRSSNTTVTLSPNQKVCDVNINPVSASGGSTGSTKSGE